MRRDRDRILDILEALDSLKQSLDGCTEEEFFLNDTIFSASAYQLTVVGEAAARISAETKESNSKLEWRRIAGLRNILVHEYFGVDRAMVWKAATADATLLRDQLALILKEFPE